MEEPEREACCSEERSILGIAKKLKEKNGRFVVSDLRNSVKEVFDISGFSAIIPVSDSVEGAMNGDCRPSR